jgi:N,N-dimethylformamidase
MTGTHPEYVSRDMLVALDAYLWGGGRLMYMGGNGFYWVTSVDPAAPHVIEVRRGESGTRAWQAAPGEYYHSTTGEPGGLWRFRGWPPQSLVGVGFTAQGTDRASPYRRVVADTDPEVGFAFEGVPDEPLGDFGLHLGGAAGWELDRTDDALGTSPLARTLATSVGHSDSYQHAVEEAIRMSAHEGGSRQPLVRADMVYVPYPNGGAVFSAGSISYAGCLSHNGYDNNISRITSNVLTRFLRSARRAEGGAMPDGPPDGDEEEGRR